MHQRTFTGTDPKFSEVGLGCLLLGGTEWGELSDEQAMTTLAPAVDERVNFFDTADVYGLGRSESA